MNRLTARPILTSLLLTALVISLLVATIPPGAAQASPGSINLTIDNRATSGISLALQGPGVYTLKVGGESSQVFKVLHGIYSYTLKGCGMTVTGKLSLTQDTTLINPICGGNVKAIPKDPSKVNLGALLKVVPVKISSELDYSVQVILTGPSTYVFTLKPDQNLAVTIGKGAYQVKYYACGVNVKQSFLAYKNAKLILDCP